MANSEHGRRITLTSKKETPALETLQQALGYRFTDASLLVRALTHVSYDRKKTGSNNEVLEFLGDAVLDLAISDLLIRHFPKKTEGDLSRMRAGLVNSVALAEKAMALDLGSLLRLGKGEERSAGRTKESILAGAFEAVLGGVYQDGGYDAGLRIVENFFAADIAARTLGQQDYKTRLQEISQLLFRMLPIYRVISETGPDHDKFFVTEIAVGGRVLGTGEGRSKKQSEQEAAKKALHELRRSGEGPAQE
jgi:ribonuclease III